MSAGRIPIYDPRPQYEALREELEGRALAVLRSGGYVLGPEVEAFEAAFAAHVGCRHAVGVNSGTDALAIALAARGVGRGDEVVTSPFTFFATAEAISLVGATPRFADIDPATCNLDPEAAAAAVGPRTRALLPVHLYGLSAGMEELAALARRHGLAVVEDVAQACGAGEGGRRLGAWGDAGAFSFYPTKNLGGFGDGGAITTDDEGLAARCRALRVHGATARDRHEHIGFNSRLDAVQAALLAVKLPHLDAWNAERRAAAARYEAALAGLPGLVTPGGADDGGHVYHQYTVRIPGPGRRDAVLEALQAAGVGAMVYYRRPVHRQPPYGWPQGSLPEAERAAEEVLSLPIWPGIAAETQDRVIEALTSALRRIDA